MADVNYAQNNYLDRNMFERLTALDFIKRRENTILTGVSGTGKSYLAQALGHQACMMQHRTVYANTSRILKRLKLAKVDGTYL